jgi:hypothetical protein
MRSAIGAGPTFLWMTLVVNHYLKSIIKFDPEADVSFQGLTPFPFLYTDRMESQALTCQIN